MKDCSREDLDLILSQDGVWISMAKILPTCNGVFLIWVAATKELSLVVWDSETEHFKDNKTGEMVTVSDPTFWQPVYMPDDILFKGRYISNMIPENAKAEGLH